MTLSVLSEKNSFPHWLRAAERVSRIRIHTDTLIYSCKSGAARKNPEMKRTEMVTIKF